MGNIRELEVRLTRNIGDRINERFGYREYSVRIPALGVLEPRPETKQLDLTKVTEGALAVFMSKLEGGLPQDVLVTKIPRSFDEKTIRIDRHWYVTKDSLPGKELECHVLGIVQQPAVWIVYLHVEKTLTLKVASPIDPSNPTTRV